MTDPRGASPPPVSARLDTELVRRGLARSRGQARELVEAAEVTVGGRAVSRSSLLVGPQTPIELTRTPPPWVSRSAAKLDEAVRVFGPKGLVVAGRRCLDVGASTGGFTQVLLAAGAVHVVALDVGQGQLVPVLAAHPQVTDRSGTSIRDIRQGDLGPPFDVVVADLSFISLRVALAPMAGQVAPEGDLLVLVKPQFEVGREHLGRTGVVTSAAERARALREVTSAADALGLAVLGLLPSPVRGGDGNQEYLLWLTPRPGEGLDRGAVLAFIEQAKGSP